MVKLGKQFFEELGGSNLDDLVSGVLSHVDLSSSPLLDHHDLLLSQSVSRVVSFLKMVSINLVNDIVVSIPLTSQFLRNVELLIKDREEVFLEVSLFLEPLGV